MMNLWHQLSDRFDELSQREQILIFVSGWIALLFVGYLLFLEPQMKQLSSIKLAVINTSNQLINSENQVLVMERKLNVDPDAEVDQRSRRPPRNVFHHPSLPQEGSGLQSGLSLRGTSR